MHDLHVRPLTSGTDGAQAHLVLAPGADLAMVLAAARTDLEDRYHLEHAALQVEPGGRRTLAGSASRPVGDIGGRRRSRRVP
ncbi:hypothetical protein DMB66_07270 [Actinoplanes sp. ATCC 53533]|nr:hypothetical protein DMB66_07270 [Actinoplanes sp. ATCC 53533]